MNTILVWVLVTLGGHGGLAVVAYSPPVTDLPSCQRMQEALKKMAGGAKGQCVQITVAK